MIKTITEQMKCTKIYFVIVFLFFACQSNEFKEFEAFPKEVRLNSNAINRAQILMMPMELIILGEIFIVVDLKSDYFFHLFSTSEFRYIGSFVRRGRGPEEEVFVNPFVHKTSDTSFFYQTINSLKTIALSRENYFSLKTVETFELPASYYDLQKLFKIGDLLIAAPIDTVKNEFISFFPGENDFNKFGPEYPFLRRKLSLNQVRRLTDKVITVKPDKEKFSAAYLLFPIIRIFNGKDGLLEQEIRLKNSQSFPEAFIADNPTKSQMGKVMNNYRSIKSTNNYIYVLYVGKINNDLSYPWSDFSKIGDHSNEIHVFNWEGIPIKRILLDRAIFSFDVSYDDKTLIASSIKRVDELFKYSLTWD